MNYSTASLWSSHWDLFTVKEGGKITWRNHVPELAVTLPLKNSTEHNVIVIAVMLFHNTLVLSCYRPTKLGKKQHFTEEKADNLLGFVKNAGAEPQ